MKPPKSRKAELGSNATGGEKPHAETAESAEFKMTELGPIPVDWEVAEISDLYEVRSSKRVFQSQWRSSGIPFYRARDIVGFRHGEQAIGGLFIDKALYEKYKRDYGVPSIDDLLVTAVGTLGSVFRVSNESPFYFKDGNIIWFKSKGKYDSRLLEVLFESGFLDSQIYDTAGGSTVGTYTISNAKKTLIPLPPLAEQRRIARALSDVDELISALGKLIEKKRNIKTGTMQELLGMRNEECGMRNVPRRRLAGFSSAWVEKRLGEIGDFIAGNGFPLNKQGDKSGDYPFFKVSDFNNTGNENVLRVANNYISESTFKELHCSLIPSGSIVFAKIGAAIALERKRRVCYDSCIDNNMMAFCVNRQNDERFITECLRRVVFADLAESTALPALNVRKLREYKIVVPLSLAEQRAIATVLSDMDAEIAALEAKRTKYESIKQGMMQELLTGRTRLKP
ncbi:MAG: restriction endonuclease subunit S [Kiritimatiellae bacterium]|nr:restriction endonuclease subunit S [Kiritimatiellia bacterium]